MKAGFGTASGSEGGGDSGFVPPPVEAIATFFPQLEIIELIGRGGMGAVYKARQPGLDRLVALKILPPRPGSDPGFAERFTREARALAKLSHPSIVAVYDFGQVSGAGVPPACAPSIPPEAAATPTAGAPRHSTLDTRHSPALHYFLMEYVDGPNLRQLERAGKLTPREALQIVPQICEALQYAHDEGIVHRDIKPENVLLDKKGRVKIADFGLAKILGREPQDFHLTGAGQVMGTPHYMAPEQVEHPQNVDHRADIYSLGVVFYEMLTGELPLGKFAPPSRKVQVDVRLDDVVLRALEKEPERRYQSASQVKSAVETLSTQPIQTPSPVVPTATVAPQPPEARIHKQVKLTGIGLAFVACFNWLLAPVCLYLVMRAWATMDLNGRVFSKLTIVSLLATPFVLCSLNIYAALRMMRLEAYGAALVASIFAMLVPPGNLLGFPIGIWSLVVLARSEVREAFQKRKAALAAAGAGRSAKTPLWFWLLAVAPVVAIMVVQLVRSVSVFGGASVPPSKVGEHRAISAQLAALKKQERELRTTYKESHPAVQAARDEINKLKREQEDLELEFPSLGHGGASSSGLTMRKTFNPPDQPISGELTITEDNAWAVSCTTTQTFRLFEVPNPGVERCMLTYRAKLKSEGLVGQAYLEMWCQIPGFGESFSRGLGNTISGSSGWATCQTPFFLKAGEKPDLIRLNLVVEGRGKVFIKDIELTSNTKDTEFRLKRF
jgi:serine/threonine protein kinase